MYSESRNDLHYLESSRQSVEYDKYAKIFGD